MIPISLKLSGFLSYRSPVEISFSSFDLAAISGANGAGKSSLLDAMTWALFGQARRRDDAVINSGSEAAEVTFDFDYEGQHYRVQRTKVRNKTTMLEFFIRDADGGWRALTEHSLRETEARIEHILRMDYETFTNASFFLQGKADQFAQQRPGDRKRILSSILGLEVWDAYREEAVNRRKVAESRQGSIDGQLREIDQELQQENARKLRLTTLETELSQLSDLVKATKQTVESLNKLRDSLNSQKRMVDLLAGQLDAARGRLDQHKRQSAERQQEQQQYIDRLQHTADIEAAFKAWQDSREALERWENLAANFRQFDQERAAPRMAIEAERASLTQEQRTLLNQQSQVDALRAQILQLSDQVSEYQRQIEALEARLLEKSVLQEEQTQLVRLNAEAQAENNRLKLEMQDLKDRINQLEETTGAECPLCGQPLSPDERDQLIHTLEARGKELADTYRANLSRFKESEQRQKAIEQDLAGFSKVDNDLRAAEQRLSQARTRLEQAQENAASWEAGGQVRLAEINEILATDNYAHGARQELARIEAKLKEIGYDAAAHDAARRLEQQGRTSEEQMRQLDIARAALGPLEREIAGLEEQIRQDGEEIKGLDAKHKAAQEQYEAESANLPSIDEAETKLFALTEQENRLRMDVGGARQEVEVLKNLKVRQAELNAERSEITRQVTRLRTLEHAFSKDGIPALLIEQALPEIEEEANDILQRLSDGSMSVRFDTQRDYKDKSRDDKKETLDIIISDPSGPREYELFSGGEAFRVNFAIRLAMSKVLAQRSGARLQTLVIDEGFGSQDVEGRQRLIEALNLVSPDFRKVLVITHLEELKDAFPARIEVEKSPTGSQVRVVSQ